MQTIHAIDYTPVRHNLSKIHSQTNMYWQRNRTGPKYLWPPYRSVADDWLRYINLQLFYCTLLITVEPSRVLLGPQQSVVVGARMLQLLVAVASDQRRSEDDGVGVAEVGHCTWVGRRQTARVARLYHADTSSNVTRHQVCVEPRPSALNMTLPAFAAERGRLQETSIDSWYMVPAAIDRYLLPALSSKPAARRRCC